MTRELIRIPIDDATPSPAAILKAQGIPDHVAASAKVLDLVNESINRYQALARPVGVLLEVSRADFDIVYRGEGQNAEETPLEMIYGSAHHLALFAVTIGEQICQEITRFFEQGEPAVGALLDTVASEGTELAAMELEDRYQSYLRNSGLMHPSTGMMRFSPGYCGWDLSAQRKLFELLRPDEIGIVLLQSYLMRPLKSISGVMVAGPREIFAFEDDYRFCGTCDTHSCRERIRAVAEHK